MIAAGDPRPAAPHEPEAKINERARIPRPVGLAQCRATTIEAKRTVRQVHPLTLPEKHKNCEPKRHGISQGHVALYRPTTSAKPFEKKRQSHEPSRSQDESHRIGTRRDREETL